jgi:hypothetical protein
MSISPFSARPTTPPRDGGRSRLVVLIATLGIAATLLAYAVSPGVRHAVSHAAHSVNHAVSSIVDKDKPAAAKKATSKTSVAPARKSTPGSSTHTTAAGGTPAP